MMTMMVVVVTSIVIIVLKMLAMVDTLLALTRASASLWYWLR
jgi:hypothetical protein